MDLKVENLTKSAKNHYLLLPNINKSDRDLPGAVSAGDLQQPVKLDRDLPVRRLADREIYSVMIDLTPEEKAELKKPSKQLNLILTYNQDLYKVLNKSGLSFPTKDPDRLVIDLKQQEVDNTKSRGIQLFLEAQTFIGSPVLAADGSPGLKFEFQNEAGSTIKSITAIGGAGIKPADVILIGDHAPAERFFMCQLVENQPSVAEVSAAASLIGVPLTLVPPEVSMGDTWLQDQFQLGYTANGKNGMQVIVHLPRMVNDSALMPTAPNLKNFVDNFFPSKTIGVFKDFWAKEIAVSDGTNRKTIGVSPSYVVFKELVFVRQVLAFIFSQLEKVNPDETGKNSNFNFNNLFNVRLEINRAFQKLNAFTNVTAEQRGTISNLKTLIGKMTTLTVNNGTVELTLVLGNAPEKFAFTADNKDFLNIFLADLYKVHSPGNYGGNIEISPPLKDAPYGKIITGSVASDELKHFLTSRGTLQPLASVYTSWLLVGHIDEIMCFVQDSSAQAGFAVCRASPPLAVALLEQLKQSQAQGMLVTRLFRGKKWSHQAMPGAGNKHLPPNAYVDHVNPKTSQYDLSGLTKKFEAGPPDGYYDSLYHDDRRFMILNHRAKVDAIYAAFITCEDLLRQVKVTNRAVEDLFLADTYNYADDLSYTDYYNADWYKKEALPARLDKILKTDFAGVPVYPLPVLFDRAQNFANSTTKAIIPDLVNLQTLNQHVLVPRPYGPRMKIDDALAFMKAFLTKTPNKKLSAFAQGKLDKYFITGNGLHLTTHWTKAGEKVGVAHVGKLPTEFDPEFEEMWQSIYQSIYASNAYFDAPSLFEIQHMNDPFTNHLIVEMENLFYIANYFKDGFDEFKNCPVDFCRGDTEKSHPKQDDFDKNIKLVMDRIKQANPGVFDNRGEITTKTWVRLVIPENTVDIFELYSQLVFMSVGLTVHWVDSWYYHTHEGGIHCGTNVLRSYS